MHTWGTLIIKGNLQLPVTEDLTILNVLLINLAKESQRMDHEKIHTYGSEYKSPLVLTSSVVMSQP